MLRRDVFQGVYFVNCLPCAMPDSPVWSNEATGHMPQSLINEICGISQDWELQIFDKDGLWRKRGQD